jgi:hypothetical protein
LAISGLPKLRHPGERDKRLRQLIGAGVHRRQRECAQRRVDGRDVAATEDQRKAWLAAGDRGSQLPTAASNAAWNRCGSSEDARRAVVEKRPSFMALRALKRKRSRRRDTPKQLL